MSEKNPRGIPPRPVAPHVQAAVGAVQAKAAGALGVRTPAPHVRAATGAAQAKAAPKPAAVQARPAPPPSPAPAARAIQPKVGFEYEIGTIKTQKRTRIRPPAWASHSRGEMIKPKTGYDVTADRGPDGTSQLEFIIKEVDESDAAACARAVAAANQILADIRNLTRDQTVGQWVGGDQTRIHTGQGHRFKSEQAFRHTLGQLQATAGLSVARLPEVVSGRAANLPVPWYGRRTTRRGGVIRGTLARPFLGSYSSHNGQPIWLAARNEARRRFPRFDDHQQEVLASVITIIAQVPLALRNVDTRNQGMFTAKTDFSKIMAEVVAHIGRPIAVPPFETAVLNTINQIIRDYDNPLNVLRATDGVFPPGYRANGVAMGGVSIRQWLRDMLPSRAGRQGTDLMTPQDFPGTPNQREEMRAFGRMGNRTDPGNRPIFELRNLTSVAPEQLPDAVRGVLEYVRSANTPPTTGWGTYLGWAAAATATVATYYFRNEIANWWYGG